MCALFGCVVMGGPLALSAHFLSAHLLTHVLVCDASTAANCSARLLTSALNLRLPPYVRLINHKHSYSTVAGGLSNSATALYDPQGAFCVCSFGLRSLPFGAPARARACLRRIHGRKLARTSALICCACLLACGFSNMNTARRRLAAALAIPRLDGTIRKG